MGYARLAGALILVLASPAVAQVVILHIRVVEGEGAVHIPGSRARPITVEVADETGKPVSGASVSFHLPESGPGGAFASSLRTTIAITDARGRATVQSFQVNHTAGRFQILIVASKEQARAGIASFQYIAESGAIAPAPPVQRPAAVPEPRRPAPASVSTRSHSRWYVLAAAAGAGVAAGILASGRSGGSQPVPIAPQPPAFSVGAPSITVGKP